MKIIVLGDGLLSSEICRQSGWKFLSRKKDGIDFRTMDRWLHLLDAYDIIFNGVACTDTYATDKSLSWQVNFAAVADLVDYCNAHDKKLVHVSTDYVYANSSGVPSEEDVPVHQETHYAYTKLLADGYIELRSKHYLIVRGTHKPKPFPYAKAWEDQQGNFDYVDVIAALIIQLIEKNAQGVFNVGTQIKTMHELAKQSQANVQATLRAHPLVPQSVAMNTNKLQRFLNKPS